VHRGARKTGVRLRVPGSLVAFSCADQRRGKDLKILGPAFVASKYELISPSRPRPRIDYRLVVESDLLARRATECYAVNLLRRAEAGRNQHCAVGQPILEIGASGILVSAQ
jgi:hypothetical protein